MNNNLKMILLIIFGIIVFDDYGIHGTEKLTNYLNNLRNNKNISKKFHFITNFFGQCILIKK